MPQPSDPWLATYLQCYRNDVPQHQPECHLLSRPVSASSALTRDLQQSNPSPTYLFPWPSSPHSFLGELALPRFVVREQNPPFGALMHACQVHVFDAAVWKISIQIQHGVS
ncbi:hypothetical protein LX36DRAFT_102796 [Colletotrichum falcatum]|nr:hypothetical protein LX36DRAFT_102796 [Colletotrichum falcatum]